MVLRKEKKQQERDHELSMTDNEIKAWFRYHEQELQPEQPRRWEPTLKPLSELIDLACEMPELHLANAGPERVYHLIAAKMLVIGLPIQAAVAYTNFASHNALSIRELAVEMKVNKDTVVVWFKRLRQEWPQLFCGALLQELNAELAIQAERDKSLLRRILGEE
jgi:hypothetical protein